jgi:hypothetical protein
MERTAKNKKRTWRRAVIRGAVMVEYAFLLTAVGIPMLIGISAGGKALLHNYQQGRNWLLQPVP